jgi:hypothetical protein
MGPYSMTFHDNSTLGDFRRVAQSERVRRTEATAVINLRRFQERDRRLPVVRSEL